jgi:uncharacterized membrane protein YhaH (DUF805 family)
LSWSDLLLNPKGRINRPTFWLACAVLGLAWCLLAALDAFVLSGPAQVAVSYLGYAVVILCYTMAAAKRLHDRDRSAWWLLLVYGPPAAALAAIAFGGASPSLTPAMLIALDVLALPALWGFVELFLLPGTQGPNRYGPFSLRK